MSYTKTYGGAVYLTFNGESITLTAADLTNPRFAFEIPNFYDAINLGQIQSALTSILNKFNSVIKGAVSLNDIEEQINNLTNIPVLGQILDSDLVITDFVVQPPSGQDATDGKYAFGFGLSLTSDNTLGPLTLDGVSFSVELTQNS